MHSRITGYNQMPCTNCGKSKGATVAPEEVNAKAIEIYKATAELTNDEFLRTVKIIDAMRETPVFNMQFSNGMGGGMGGFPRQRPVITEGSTQQK
jgi:hypothetical protein